MITIKKIEIEALILQIVAFDSKTQKPVAGLLTETTSLGMKRRLQKIHTLLVEKYKEFVEDVKKIEEECKEDSKKLESEITTLLEEEITIDALKIDSKMLDSIVSTSNYNFEILEKITE